MTHELTVEAKTENIETILSFLNPLIEEQGFSSRSRKQIDVALDELFSNIARCAYPEGGGQVVFQADFDGEGLSLTIRDWGIPYDPLAKEDPDVTLPFEERGVGGLGIFIVKQIMDDLRYERRDGQNIVTLRKDRE